MCRIHLYSQFPFPFSEESRHQIQAVLYPVSYMSSTSTLLSAVCSCATIFRKHLQLFWGPGDLVSSTWEHQTLPLTPSAHTTTLKQMKHSIESGLFSACFRSYVASYNSGSRVTLIKWHTAFKNSSHPKAYLSEDLLPWFALEVSGQTHLWMRYHSVSRAA